MKHAIVVKRKLNQALRDAINADRTKCIWSDAYLNLSMLDKKQPLNSDLIVATQTNFYQPDVIYNVEDLAETGVVVRDYIFHVDNVEREKNQARTIWRHDKSPSMSVGDIIFTGDIGEFERTSRIVEGSRVFDLDLFEGWICCNVGWRLLYKTQRELFKSALNIARLKASILLPVDYL